MASVDEHPMGSPSLNAAVVAILDSCDIRLVAQNLPQGNKFPENCFVKQASVTIFLPERERL